MFDPADLSLGPQRSEVLAPVPDGAAHRSPRLLWRLFGVVAVGLLTLTSCGGGGDEGGTAGSGPADGGGAPGGRMAGWIVLALVVVLGLYAVVLYNGVIKLRNGVENAWAQIEVQLRRRHDLIPNLVETVQGYAAHERETLEAVTRTRNAAMGARGVAEQARAENVITSALKSLFALSEAYPDLKANQNFLALQEELSGTEGRIAYARQFYNDSVFRYNTKIASFPAMLIAGLLRFRTREYFEADDTSWGPVQVDF